MIWPGGLKRFVRMRWWFHVLNSKSEIFDFARGQARSRLISSKERMDSARSSQYQHCPNSVRFGIKERSNRKHWLCEWAITRLCLIVIPTASIARTHWFTDENVSSAPLRSVVWSVVQGTLESIHMSHWKVNRSSMTVPSWEQREQHYHHQSKWLSNLN